VPVCGAGLGSKFFRRVSAAFSAAVCASSFEGVIADFNFVGFSNASFPGGIGAAFPDFAVVRMILFFTNL